MNTERLDRAVEEAKRFLERAEALRSKGESYGGYGPESPIERGACRRASMDLTRSLAALRRHPS